MRFRTLILLAHLAALAVLAGCGHTPPQPSAPSASRAADHALAMVGKPYRYGGNTPEGFDCSGLVQYSYARVGVQLPQGTHNLRQVSQPVSRANLKRGDLVFFMQDGRRSSHVALYLGDGRFVHAPSRGKRVHVAGFHDAYWQRHFTEARRIEID